MNAMVAANVRLRGLVAAALVTVVATQLDPRAQSRVVPLRLPDGRMISGTWMEAQNRPAAAVVLVPMLGRPRDEWQTVGQRLAEGNINALARARPSGRGAAAESERTDAME